VSSRQLIFGTQVCGDLAAGGRREWLVPDGCGGFAMGTVSGLRTRRYHALLVASREHPGARQVTLVSLDPVLDVDGAKVSLAVHEWSSGVIDPVGHTLLSSFALADGLPIWRWQIGDTVLERTLAMTAGRPAVGVVHRLISGPPVRLTLTALGTYRDAHAERFGSGPSLAMTPTADGVLIEDAYRLAGAGFVPDGRWYVGAHLREEAARGLPPVEDLWCAGQFAADLEVGESLDVTAWFGDLDTPPPPAPVIVEEAIARNRSVVAAAGADDDVDATLALAAAAFVVNGPDVVAGYPWFGAWSRDTMTSYEGLFLTSGRADQGRDLLLRYAEALSQGMLPNTADAPGEGGAPEYNSIDAPLWFIHAVGRHVAVTGDTDLAAALIPKLTTIIDGYAGGTRFDIHLDDRSLVAGGTPGNALTWMDARVAGVPITARIGAPVEINSLWINALGTLAVLSGDPSFDARRTAAVAGFEAAFGTAGPLPDVITATGPDRALRPNQLLAYALPYGPLHGARPGAVLGARLLTPLGIRTLSPLDPAYQGSHHGDGPTRDRAYHQGTVWPWLIGPYVGARLAAGLPADGVLDGLEAHLRDYGLGSVSETADGDAPHVATGCPFQAWSVAQFWVARRALLAIAGRGRTGRTTPR
jgi:predicted glycogen debranching enzyme